MLFQESALSDQPSQLCMLVYWLTVHRFLGLANLANGEYIFCESNCRRPAWAPKLNASFTLAFNVRRCSILCGHSGASMLSEILHNQSKFPISAAPCRWQGANEVVGAYCWSSVLVNPPSLLRGTRFCHEHPHKFASTRARPRAGSLDVYNDNL